MTDSNCTPLLLCSRCKSDLPETSFSIKTATKRGRQNICRKCASEYSKCAERETVSKRSQEQKELRAEGTKRCSCCGVIKPNNLIEFGLSRGRTSSYCRPCIRTTSSARDTNLRSDPQQLEKLKARQKQYRAANKTKVRDGRKRYYEANKEYLKGRVAARSKEKGVELTRSKNAANRKRALVDPTYALSVRIRRLIQMSLSAGGYGKKSSTLRILGCDFSEFKAHIESLFMPGMTWDNRTEWHLDHYIPVSFANTEDEVLRLNHYSNLRPLWAKDNLRKNARLPDGLTHEEVRSTLYAQPVVEFTHE